MRVVAVTGGAQGIGRAVCLFFANAGYAVSLADPDAAAGREVAKMIEKTGSKSLFVRTDVGVASQIARWVARTVGEFGCPDALVNNAGIGRRAPFLKLKARDFDHVIAVNLRGTFLCSQAFAKHMAKRGRGGAIVNIASTRAFMSEPGTEAYTASKGGIVALTHGMAMSLGPMGIRVNSVSPGWIETRDWQYSRRSRKPLHSKKDRLQHPVGRVGRPEDIAEACFYLVEQAGFMTGQNVTLDGGMTAKMIYEE
ncbi:MAG TPA: SDR family oxidoreductase [Burkholderiales bacterium]|nr:SDR family oxidoreductase [Burkholderiales bacterium]